MKHLLDINSLNNEQILEIMNLASRFELLGFVPKLLNKKPTVAFLFFENSTRTKFSFELAAKNLNYNTLDFNFNTSSLSKGEDFFDTLNNLSAIGADIIVVRSSDDFIYEYSKKKYPYRLSFVNAGSGVGSHPTQALLDFYTIQKHLGSVYNKKIVIVGDIKHSRVAKSNIELLNRVGAKVVCVAPKCFQDENIKNVQFEEDLFLNTQNADVVMALRIQKERIEEEIDYLEYIENYQINEGNFNTDAILMHPGPVNWGVELSKELQFAKCSKIILEQAHNGTFVRMAILNLIVKGIYGSHC